MSDLPVDITEMGKLQRLFDINFLDYTSYVIRDRAIPDIDDGEDSRLCSCRRASQAF